MDNQPTRNIFVQVFISPNEPRLRAGWRILTHALIYNLLLICSAIPFTIQFMIAGGDVEMLATSLLPTSFIALFATTLSVFLTRPLIDRRPIASLGLKLNWTAALDLLVGILLAGLLMGIIYLIELKLGWLTFDSFAWKTETLPVIIKGIGLALLTCLIIGWYEELLFRGYRLTNLAEGLNPFWAVLISSVWFGIGHIFNPGASWVSTLGIFLAGVFLAYPYLRTGQLWFSIGLHIGWNFFEGPVFGFPVSGIDFFQLTRTSIHGPELWTGGAFGPEAGLILLPALALGMLLIYLCTLKRLPADNPFSQ